MKTSLIVLTCNRKDSVIALLESLDAQSKIPDEIIVVDNASNDGTYESLKKDYSNIRTIRLSKNIGASGRNEGLKCATGDIIITLDDDVFFAEPEGVEKIEKIFSENDDVHVINFKILDGETKQLLAFNWFHPYSMEKYSDKILRTDYISEGAVCFRREIFEQVGYYPYEFFISHEGPDLAFRILDEGYNIYYFPDIKVLHKCSTEHRVTWRNTYYDTRNQIWLAVRNLPLIRAIFHIIYRLLTTFLFSVRRKQIKWYFKAIFDAVKGLRNEIKYRRPISNETIRKIRRIRQHRPGFFYNLSSFLYRTRSINKKFAR